METSAETILKKATVHTLNINEGSPLHDAVISAMKEYTSNQTAQLKADKAELIENHFRLFRRLNSLVNRHKLSGFDDILEKSKEINRKHSEGGLNIVQSNP